MKFTQHAMCLPRWSRRRTSESGGEREGPGPQSLRAPPIFLVELACGGGRTFAAVSDATMRIGRVQVRRWPAAEAARLVVLVHGYAEHIGRYARERR
jgi:hypothetical protein